jgi:predicted restriction endonuclease
LLASWVGKWCTAKELEEYLGQGKEKHHYTVSRGSLVIKERGDSWDEYPEKARAAASEEGYFDPSSIEDSRKKCLTSIYRRQGQPEFRQALRCAYGGRCAVTGCDAIDALEAAHIYPYRGRSTNVVTNGLLLRADIHTLFDLNLLGICPSNYSIVLSERLRGTTYQEFEGKTIVRPIDEKHHPSTLSLERRWIEFLRHISSQRG